MRERPAPARNGKSAKTMTTPTVWTGPPSRGPFLRTLRARVGSNFVGKCQSPNSSSQRAFFCTRGKHKKPVAGPAGGGPKSHLLRGTGLFLLHVVGLRPGEGRAGPGLLEQLAGRTGGQGLGPAGQRSSGGPGWVTNWSSRGGPAGLGGFLFTFRIGRSKLLPAPPDYRVQQVGRPPTLCSTPLTTVYAAGPAIPAYRGGDRGHQGRTHPSSCPGP